MCVQLLLEAKVVKQHIIIFARSAARWHNKCGLREWIGTLFCPFTAKCWWSNIYCSLLKVKFRLFVELFYLTDNILYRHFNKYRKRKRIISMVKQLQISIRAIFLNKSKYTDIFYFLFYFQENEFCLPNETGGSIIREDNYLL